MQPESELMHEVMQQSGPKSKRPLLKPDSIRRHPLLVVPNEDNLHDVLRKSVTK